MINYAHPPLTYSISLSLSVWNISFQDEPSQQSSHLPEDADGETPPPPPPAAAFSQLRSSQSSSQSVLRADLSQDNPASSRLSQSQSSQGRPRLPQASQPKKKSRMGFWGICQVFSVTRWKTFVIWNTCCVCDDSYHTRLLNGSMALLTTGIVLRKMKMNTGFNCAWSEDNWRLN